MQSRGGSERGNTTCGSKEEEPLNNDANQEVITELQICNGA